MAVGIGLHDLAMASSRIIPGKFTHLAAGINARHQRLAYPSPSHVNARAEVEGAKTKKRIEPTMEADQLNAIGNLISDLTTRTVELRRYL